MAGQSAATQVLAGGHELGGTTPGFTAVPGGRPLLDAVAEALAAGEGPVCVVPMTLGRDPKLIADTARALHWLAEGEGAGRLVLSEPFGTKDHLTGWLRAAAGKAVGGMAAAGKPAAPDAPRTAILVTAPAAGPFEDADLFRVARLVRQYGQHRLVEVAFAAGDPGLAEGAERCRLLGAERVVMIPAAFGPSGAEQVAGAEDGGPLLSASAIDGVIAARTAEALHRLAHGDNGIAAGRDAEHGHGYAHSHGPGTSPHTHH
ncbi:sirohydrochlorin chelatase [Streptomyces sp. NBC_01304]|uniref:sirohydrochlorin chelatase n=1 Tax=Streptomyces sp. NBC_01304 TaxID=2903818 RepID=UPI002E134CBE|nr:cobalamin biosynthesis protein CbiX [Streptomyces sp. NBC_01304]